MPSQKRGINGRRGVKLEYPITDRLMYRRKLQIIERKLVKDVGEVNVVRGH